jgi:hypothetical protein
MFLDIIHRLVHFLKTTTEIGASSINWIQLKTETESSLRNVVVFKNWTRRWIMSKNIILVRIFYYWSVRGDVSDALHDKFQPVDWSDSANH